MTIHRHDLLGSTNDEAFRLAHAGASHGTVVMARQQTAGRGRQGRAWISPPGNLYASVLLRTAAFRGGAAARAPEIGFVAAVAVADTLIPLADGLQLKWPNDVLLAGAKVAGILTEMTGEVIVAGIGINVAHAPPDMPYPVTSLAAHAVTADAEAILATLIDRFLQRLHQWDEHGFAPIRAAWLRHGPAPGQPLTARIDHTHVDGTFAGLAEDGALLLATPMGTNRIVSGEVGQP